MKALFSRKWFVLAFLLLIAASVYLFIGNRKPVDFNTQIKPIFNKKCISCHGGVKRKGGFSLLFRSEALAVTESGSPAIIPGKPGESEMIRRLTLTDPEERMPYKHDALSAAEIKLLTNWIREGAKWGDHWAYLPVKAQSMPVINTNWPKNSIDTFIAAKWDVPGLTPAPEADRPTLLRRVSLDLTGMLPGQQLAERFLTETNPLTYEQLVDSLLASPHFGERWAALWLDLARYADTKGYESDGGRNIWKYRDWVIRAFNEDMPYDQFLRDQLAGDLLPNPTDAQYIATAFHRNAMSNDEGGTDNEEFRTAAVIDRVNTTWEALMGTSFGCVQCHSHPYDPFRHEEYYKFLAYFNNTRDEDVPDEYPLLRDFNDSMQTVLSQLTSWLETTAGDSTAAAIRYFLKTWQPAINSTTVDNISNNTIENNNYSLLFRNHSQGRMHAVNLQQRNRLLMRFSSWKPKGVLRFHLDSLNGPLLLSYAVKTTSGNEIVELSFPQQSGTHDIYLAYDNPAMKDPKEYGIMFNWFYFTRAFPGEGLPGYATNLDRYNKLLRANTPTTPILLENPADMRRETHVFERGNWMAKGDKVTPDVPQSLHYAMPANAPANRLGLTRWLTSPQHPLVSRTLVNRLWEQLFGVGIAETLEDLGTQGIPPTHQALLDHLSWQLMHQYNWSVKRLLKELVLSATYRQSAVISPEALKKDPANKYYARAPRTRLSAEQIRDQHLGICGQLNDELYGPSVMPWQPDRIWLSPYNGARWHSATDSSRFRRALYTYWKRSSPYPAMIAFDGAQRNVCMARRIRTNTPLQALVTLNDSAYLEMARHFALRMLRSGKESPAAQIDQGYQWMLFKPLAAEKRKHLEALYQRALAEFNQNPEKAAEMTGSGKTNGDPKTAAMVVVANAMLNLDEVIVKN